MIKDTTVDFVIKLKDGGFYCRKKVILKYRTNHLVAYSFHTRKDAERFAPRDSVILKRLCMLETSE